MTYTQLRTSLGWSWSHGRLGQLRQFDTHTELYISLLMLLYWCAWVCVFAFTCLLKKTCLHLGCLGWNYKWFMPQVFMEMITTQKPIFKGYNFPKNILNNCCHPWGCSQKLPKRISYILSSARAPDRSWGHQIMGKVMALKTSHFPWPRKYKTAFWGLLLPLPARELTVQSMLQLCSR